MRFVRLMVDAVTGLNCPASRIADLLIVSGNNQCGIARNVAVPWVLSCFQSLELHPTRLAQKHAGQLAPGGIRDPNNFHANLSRRG